MSDLWKDALKITLITLAVLKRAGFNIVDRMMVLKTAYLIEREYFRLTGKRLTSLPYYNYTYGPFNGLIIEVLEALSKKGRNCF